ncbi:MAG: hypothetical protein RJA70_582 [Pseudomonadota bacterium]
MVGVFTECTSQVFFQRRKVVFGRCYACQVVVREAWRGIPSELGLPAAGTRAESNNDGAVSPKLSRGASKSLNVFRAVIGQRFYDHAG